MFCCPYTSFYKVFLLKDMALGRLCSMTQTWTWIFQAKENRVVLYGNCKESIRKEEKLEVSTFERFFSPLMTFKLVSCNAFLFLW